MTEFTTEELASIHTAMQHQLAYADLYAKTIPGIRTLQQVNIASGIATKIEVIINERQEAAKKAEAEKKASETK